MADHTGILKRYNVATLSWDNMYPIPGTHGHAISEITNLQNELNLRLHSDVFPLTLDTPITELNNHSLREVFEDGNMIDVIDKPFAYGTNTQYYISQNAQTNVQITLNNYYYEKTTFELKNPTPNTNVSTLFQHTILGSNRLLKAVAHGSNEYIVYDMSFIWKNMWSTENITIVHIALISPSTTKYDIDDYVKTSNNYFIDLTSLGIDTLTVEQMDYWYGVYSRLKPYDDVIKGLIPVSLAELSEDASHRVVTDTEKNTWNNKLGSVPNDHVTNERLANVPTLTLKGRVSASTGDPQDLTMDAVKTMLTYNQDEVGDGTTYKRVTQANKDAWDAKQNALGYTPVPTTREIVGLPLSGDITQSALKSALAYIHSDVGAQQQNDKLTALAALSAGTGLVNKTGTSSFGLVDPSSIGTINNINMNGVSNQNPSFYAPTLAGTDHYILGSAGSGAPEWITRWGYLATRTSTSLTPSLSLYGHKAMFIYTGTTTRTITISSYANQAFPIGTEFTIINLSTGATQFSLQSGVTVNGSTATITYNIQYKPMKLIKVDTDAWVAEYSA